MGLTLLPGRLGNSFYNAVVPLEMRTSQSGNRRLTPKCVCVCVCVGRSILSGAVHRPRARARFGARVLQRSGQCT